MVRAEVGNIEDFGAVVQNADAVVSQAANDWAAGAWGETARCYTRLGGEGIAETGSSPFFQLSVIQNRDCLRSISRTLLDFAASDDDATGGGGGSGGWRSDRDLSGSKTSAAEERKNNSYEFFQSGFLRLTTGLTKWEKAHHDWWRPNDQSVRGDRANQLPETENRSVPNGRDNALGERRRRVLEDARAEERHRDPDRSERRNLLKTKRRLRRDENRRCIRLFAFAGGDEGDGAFVSRRAGIGMETEVELRRARKRKRAKECGKQTACDEGSEGCPAAHEHGMLRQGATGSKQISVNLLPKQFAS